MGLDSGAYRSALAARVAASGPALAPARPRDPALGSEIAALRRRQRLAAALAAALAAESDAAGLFLGSELRARVRVLRKLGYLEEADEGEGGGRPDGDGGGDGRRRGGGGSGTAAS